jgi:hypothetical protein
MRTDRRATEFEGERPGASADARHQHERYGEQRYGQKI